MGLICCAHKWKWCVSLGFFFSFFKTTIWVWPELKINSVSNNFVADLCFGPTSFPIPPSEKRVYIISIKCCHRNANGCQAAARNEFQIFYQAICLCPLLLLYFPDCYCYCSGSFFLFLRTVHSTPNSYILYVTLSAFCHLIVIWCFWLFQGVFELVSGVCAVIFSSFQ